MSAALWAHCCPYSLCLYWGSSRENGTPSTLIRQPDSASSPCRLHFQPHCSHFSAVALFLIGVFLGAWVMQLRKPSRLSLVLAPELILIVSAPLMLSAHLGGTQAFVLCVSLALGLQNGAFRRVGGIGVHTTYLTGMITSLISSTAEKCSSQQVPPPASAHDPKIALIAQIWIAFILGAISGAAATLRFKQWGMFGIGLILLLVILGSQFAMTTPQRDS